MRIKPRVPFISEVKLEQLANALLERYDREIAPISAPPIPVEEIADFLLELGLEWLDIPDTDDEPILAYLHPRSKTIRFNERRLPYFEGHPGTYQYTLAHEIGHYTLHLTPEGSPTADLDLEGNPFQVQLRRHKPAPQDPREWQAERFASYLLLPAQFLLPALEGLNLHRWPDLYRLRDQFNVSITALRIRLEKLGYLHLAANGRLYPSKAAATDDLRQDSRQWVSQGNFYRALGEVEHAREAYQRALTMAQEVGDRRSEAFCAWQLGLLYAETDPARAVALMSICLAYERETGHPEAEADAERVARLKARL